MEQFKREIFEKELGRPFVELSEASDNERIAVLDALYFKLQLDENKDVYAYLLNREAAKTLNDTYDAQWVHSSFNKDEIVYLVWNKDSVDKINVEHLVQYWDFVWYDVSDEALILFQLQTGKIAMICDGGMLVLVP